MGVGEPMQLIDAEDAKNEDRRRVSPECVKPQRRHKKRLDEPVRQQIDRSKVLTAIGEMFGGSIQMRHDEFVTVERKIELQGISVRYC